MKATFAASVLSLLKRNRVDHMHSAEPLMKAALSIMTIATLHMVGHARTCQWANSLGSTNTTTRIEQVRSYPGAHALVCGTFAATSMVLGDQTLTNNGQDDGFIALADANGDYQWATRIGGANNDIVTDVAAHTSDEFVAVGNFRSVFLTVGDTTLSNTGESDVFVAKFNADRSVAWVRQVGGTEIDEATCVRIDGSGNIHVSGQVINKFTQQTIHLFIRKYAPNGTMLWERTGISESGAAYSSALALDDEQNIYLSGWMYGTVTFDNTTLIGDQGFAAYVVKHDQNGTLLTTTMSYDHGDFTALEAHENNLYACARDVNYGIGWGWPLGDSKVYVLKLDQELNTIWSRDFGGETPNHSLDRAESLGLDAEGNVYVTGSYFSDTLYIAEDTLLNPYNAPYYYPQIFVAKYSTSGDEVWGMSAGGIHIDEATSIHVVGNDEFYLAGNFESDPAEFGTQALNNTSQLDSFYVHLYPARYGRKPMGFLAKFEAETSTGIDERDDQGFALWPNPANSSIVIRVDPSLRSAVTIEVLTLDGRVVHQVTQRSSGSVMQLDINDLAPGPYMLSLTSEDFRSTQRFIKH